VSRRVSLCLRPFRRASRRSDPGRFVAAAARAQALADAPAPPSRNNGGPVSFATCSGDASSRTTPSEGLWLYQLVTAMLAPA